VNKSDFLSVRMLTKSEG